MSDEFISDRYTFCTIFDRKHFLDFLNYWFCKIGHVTPEDMEMSGIALRIECKHSRIPAGPPSGRNRHLKSRNLGFRRQCTFFQSLGKIENGRTKKNCCQGRTKFFWAAGTGRRSFVALGAALASIKGQVLREERQCCRFLQPRIPFST